MVIPKVPSVNRELHEPLEKYYVDLAIPTVLEKSLYTLLTEIWVKNELTT